jgi:hypothetical protein
MPPFRMPFTSKRPTAPTEAVDENLRPNSVDSKVQSPYGKEKPSLALGIKEKKIEPNEFKLSCTRPPSLPHCRRSEANCSPQPSTTAVNTFLYDH